MNAAGEPSGVACTRDKIQSESAFPQATRLGTLTGERPSLDKGPGWGPD